LRLWKLDLIPGAPQEPGRRQPDLRHDLVDHAHREQGYTILSMSHFTA
jgi:hypothetical protein